MEEMQFATVTVSCQTDGCENQNIDLEVKVVYPTGVVVCGPCGKEITFTMPDSPSE
jgi:hypothetical protein